MTGDALAAFHRWEIERADDMDNEIRAQFEPIIAKAKAAKDYNLAGRTEEQMKAKLKVVADHGVMGAEKMTEYRRRCVEAALEAHNRQNPLLKNDVVDDEEY